ncbi:hypothetical protein N9Q05_02820, partial [bacterium]|nr:hypothetical protein [bacterium]
MIFNFIRQTIDTLKSQYASVKQPATLRDRVLLTYNKYVLNRLATIFTENSAHNTQTEKTALIQAVQDFLSENWSLINGTMLSYTASSTSDITQLLVSIAMLIAKEEDKKGCSLLQSQALPPDIYQTELHGFNSACIRVKGTEDTNVCLFNMTILPENPTQIDMGDFTVGYFRVKQLETKPAVNALYYVNKQTNVCIRLVMSTKQLLEFDEKTAHIHTQEALSPDILNTLKKISNHPKALNGLYYVNQQKRMFTPLQTSPQMLEECDAHLANTHAAPVFPFTDIPSYCGNLPEVIALYNSIKLLMPTVSLVSFANDYPDLEADFTVLNTHVLGDQGLYLMPVKLLTEFNLSAEAIKLQNPYFDPLIHPVTAHYFDNLNTEECQRMISHSTLTQAVWNAKQEYELLTNDTSHLLGHLKQLCQKLGFNAVGRMGTETNAGNGAYPAIINFFSYYKKLAATEINKIPKGLQKEINLLFELVTNPKKNIDATKNIDTCIDTRRTYLITEMTGHETLLSQI